MVSWIAVDVMYLNVLVANATDTAGVVVAKQNLLCNGFGQGGPAVLYHREGRVPLQSVGDAQLVIDSSAKMLNRYTGIYNFTDVDICICVYICQCRYMPVSVVPFQNPFLCVLCGSKAVSRES